MHYKEKNVNLFTLIEVMIVLAIIGIIAGIGVPQFKQYQDAAYAKKRLLAIETFKTACESYNIQFDISDPTININSWENSKGVLLTETVANGGLGLRLNPFENTDTSQTNAVYSVYDFIKGGIAALKVGNTEFIGRTPGMYNRYIDLFFWEDASMNEMKAAGAHHFYTDPDGTHYGNATGMKE